MADTSDDSFWSTLGSKPAVAPPATGTPATGTAAPSAAANDDRFWSTLGSPGAQVSPAAAKPGDIDPLTGRPYQFATTGRGPIAESTGRPIREDLVPGPGVQAAGSVAIDPEQKRRIIAQQLFPDLGPDAAQARVFYGPNGRLAAVGKDGQAFYVDPEPYSPDINQPRSLVPDNPLARAGTYAGPALPAAGAVFGGMAGGPTSLFVGPLGAGAGAAVGDLARQTIAGTLDPGVPPKPGAPPVPVPYNLLQTGSEATGAAIGQLGGASIVRGLTPNPLGANAFDLRAIQDAQMQQRLRDAYTRARAQGVDLTPGQASRLPSVIGLEDVYASGTAGPQGANIAQAFYQRQRQQLTDAFDRMTGQVSPVSDKTDAALQFQQGAEDAQRIVRQQANAAARPDYAASQATATVPTATLTQIQSIPAVKAAMDAARVEYHNFYGHAAPDTPDFNLWDLTKRKLDDAYGVQKRAGENTTATAIDNLRGTLTTELDAAYPRYAAGRAESAVGQRQSAQLGDVVGRSVGTGTERERAIVAPVFETNNPRAIATSRDAFIQAGREPEWNAGTRAYLQDQFDAASKSQEGLNPSMLIRQVWSDPNRRAALQAAMDPQAFVGFEKFMQTLQDVAQSRGINSLTAPRFAGGNALSEAAGSTPGVRAAGALKALSPMRLMDVFGAAGDAIQGWMIRRNVDKIGEYLFSPDGLKYLQDMGKLPTGARTIAATARFLGQQGGLAVAPRPANSDQPHPLKAAP